MKIETELHFDRKKALLALQGKMVITDEHSHFEWVGSTGANPCIIILIHGVNEIGEKVAVCGHLSLAESPFSVNYMLRLAGINEILSAHLVSAETPKEAPVCQNLLSILKQNGVENLTISLGQGICAIALNVKTGDVTYEPIFTVKNSGEEDASWDVLYALTAQIQIYMNPDSLANRRLLQLSVDGRDAMQVARVISLLETVQLPPQNTYKYKYMYDVLDDCAAIEEQFQALLQQTSYLNKQLKALLAPPERKMITDPAWEEAKKRLEKPQPAFSSRFFNTFLIEHRHDNLAMQHEYDKRFGLTLTI